MPEVGSPSTSQSASLVANQPQSDAPLKVNVPGPPFGPIVGLAGSTSTAQPKPSRTSMTVWPETVTVADRALARRFGATR